MMHGRVTAIARYSFDFIWKDVYRTVSFKLAADGWRNDESDSC